MLEQPALPGLEPSELVVKLKTARDHVSEVKPVREPWHFRQCPECGAIVADADDDWGTHCPLCDAALEDGIRPARHIRQLAEREPE